MSMPLIGRNAVVKKGAVDIGYCIGVRVTIDVDLVKAYRIGSDMPAVIAAGNKTFRVSIEKMYVDNTYAQDVLNGTALTIEVQPAGTGAGKPKITLSNVIFNSWELTIDQGGVIMESIEGEGDSIAFAAQ